MRCRFVKEIFHNKENGFCMELSVKTLTWDMDSDGDWAENVKGVDDYLYDLEQRK